MTTCDKMDCPNQGKLVIDANVIRYVLGGTIDIVDQAHKDKSWVQKLPEVQSSLTSNLYLIKRCNHDGHLYISDPVWSEELDVDRLRESAHPVNHSDSVYSKNEVKTLREVINGCIDIRLDTTGLEITEFRQLLRSHGSELYDHDASLMLVACKLSQFGSQAILITDDPDFFEPWRILVQLNSFSLRGVTYNTDRLTIRSYADFVTLAHDCCSCSSDKYRALFNAWFLPIIKRRITTMRQGRRTDLFRRVADAMNVMQVSLECKPK